MAVLDHVGLTVPDLDAAVDFFKRCFGASVVFRLPPVEGSAGRLGVDESASFELAMLDLGGGQLELLQWRPESTAGQPPANTAGAAHVAISVPDLADAVARLSEEDGVQVVGTAVRFAEGPTPGLANAFLTTPWGALLELMEWPTAAGKKG